MDERYSPTYLATFLGCRQAAAWELHQRRGDDTARPDGIDEQGALITRLGDEHEARILANLQATSEVAVIEGDDMPARTREAMQAGMPWIHQAALSSNRWNGYADFLRRVESPCARWQWSYEPWDAKLARHAQPKHVLQIGVYAEMLGALQGGMPEFMGLMLGGGGRDATHAEVTFTVADFRYYIRRVSERLLNFTQRLPDDFGGEPCSACTQCGWRSRCGAVWEGRDHLSRVADISREQRRRLVEANVTTLTGLADLSDMPVPARPAVGLRAETLERLSEQAALQRRTAAIAAARDADTGTDAAGTPVPPEWALLPHRKGFGLERLPPPDAADLFFDFEGDPLEPGGLEYLCGVIARAGVNGPFGSAASVPERADLAFTAFWAHDRQQERRSFEALIDTLTDHFTRHPEAHLYHYAPYETVAMKRLACSHGTREQEVDELLRSARLIDLYRVVREGVRIGAPSYSIKQLEPLYMDARATDTANGGQSVVMYHAWRASQDPSTLADIEAYNRDDCVSTALLHEWLLARRDELSQMPRQSAESAAAGTTDEVSEEEEEETESERHRREKREQRQAQRAEIDAEISRLEDELGAGDDTAEPATHDAVIDEHEQRTRQLAADLLRFHQREEKPEWWAFFERQSAAPESLIDDADCLGGCVKDAGHWGVPEKRSHTYRFRFPAQETKLSRGATPQLQSGASAGEIVELNTAAGLVTLKRGATLGEPPEHLALMPGGPLSTDPISAAVRRVVRNFAEGGDAYAHIISLLRGDAPTLKGREPGKPIVPVALLEDPAATLDATVAAVRALDNSWLCIQGPPGAGKTYTLARVIDALIDDGRTVGVSSNSHAAIDNVLRGVERYRAERMTTEGVPALSGLKKVGGRDGYDSPLGDAAMVSSFTGPKKGADWQAGVDLFGGTAWWFSAENGPSVDVLVVDEAGQVGLGHLVGMASAARNVVLVGDPMQLPQPTRGAHPRGSGASCLEHVIGEHAVVPPERGVFLGTTWRMHPMLTRFVSEAIYGGRLMAEPGCTNRRLVLPAAIESSTTHPALKPAGLSFVELDHDGCTQRCEAEAEEIVQLYEGLIGARVVDREGAERAMTADDVLVVAPYNVQVNLLRERLAPLAGDAGPRVGTVDRFQGQEAEAVLVSMTTSDAQSMPRDASFLLSRNRLNVAVSRARCLAVVVASSGLLDLEARSVNEMRLVNLLCRARVQADETAD